MKKIIFTILLITSLFAEYSVGDQISTDHQNLSFDVCYGDYDNDQLSLSDFVDGNTVIWINMSASW
ncbi:MAG: hypothetical protein HN820_04715 [Candidatus Marinimicrobia bacterium]|nr:hypothetical protein [Candidatus Neomarinimicrobiota bacterium]MBT7377438.1 hypothetical protein [Candidatus Neomarinimicrobiota bacterium]